MGRTWVEHVLSLKFHVLKSMNNLSSYCGLVDAKIRASDKDLPVPIRCTNYIQQLSDTKWPIAFHRALGSTGLFGIFSFSSYDQNATRGGSLIRLL